MKRFIPLNLSPLCNHKLIYDELPENGEEYGLDNICVLKEDFKLQKEERINGAEFRFESGTYDNVICERQSVRIDKEAEKLHMIGFAYWGNASEILRVFDEAGKEETLKIGMPDWSRAADADIFTRELFKEQNISTAKIVLSSGQLRHMVYLHHCIFEIGNNRPIHELILPDNMFMHIFAMTLETNGDD